MNARRWPAEDQRRANRADLRILTARGQSVTSAAATLGIPPRTAYRLLGRSL